MEPAEHTSADRGAAAATPPGTDPAAAARRRTLVLLALGIGGGMLLGATALLLRSENFAWVGQVLPAATPDRAE